MFYRYRLNYVVVEDPASYTIPNSEPVHIWNSSREDVVTLRKKFISQWLFASIELWILIFIISSIYLGTGQNPSRYTNNLDVALVDFDGGLAGSFLLNAFRQTAPGNATLNWIYQSPSDYNNNIDDTQHKVTDGKIWAVVVLRPDTTRLINESLFALINTTMSLTSPFTNTLPILVTYEDGRNSFTVNNYVLPAIRAAIATASGRYGQAIRGTLVDNLSSSSNPPSNASLQRLNTLQLGSLLVDPLAAKYQNLHPGSPFVGQLATTLGYIYLYLVSGMIVGSAIKITSGMVGKVHWLDLMVYRVTNGIFQAFIISLIYSLIVLWFFGIHSGSLFMRYWMFNWLSMMVFGILVALFTINLGPFGNSILTIFLVLMLAGSTIQLALELSHPFYHYGYGLPLYHILNGGRHLLFGSHSRFALDVGVLIIYFAVLWSLAILTSIYWIKRQEKKLAKTKEQTKSDKKGHSIATLTRY